MNPHGDAPTTPTGSLFGSRKVLFTNVTFKIEAQTTFGQSIKLVGDCPSLGSWQPSSAITMHTCEKCYPVWSVTVPLPVNLIVEYKYTRHDESGDVTWEGTLNNRKLLTVNDTMQVDDGTFGSIPETRIELPETKRPIDRRRSVSFKAGLSPRGKRAVADELSDRKSLLVDGDKPGTAIVVMYRLPIRARRHPDTKALEFSWDSEALYCTFNGLRDGLQGKIDVRWVGIVPDVVVAPEEQESAQNILFEKFHCIPVWISEDVRKKHYVGFCKEVLWPIFHHVVQLKDRTKPFDSENWKAYCSVNNSFAQKIMEIFQEGDLIWIHDYHLILLPSYLRRRMVLHKASIGIFLHTPFPSSEIYRVLPIRTELLHGLLAASLIGFQMFEYARHFLTSCKRLLGLEHDSRRGGFLGIEYNGRQVMIRVTHIGIDPILFQEAVKRETVVNNAKEITQKHEGCMILSGVDNLERLKGVGHKLLAFEGLLRDYPRYRGKLVLIQVCIPRRDNPESASLSAEFKEVTRRINEAYGNKETGYQPVQYEEKDVTFEDRVALYCVSDGVLVTSIRDGLNLVPYEYLISCQNRKSVVVVSEFTGCSRSLSSAIRVNPLSTEDLIVAIDKGFSMNEYERKVKYEQDCQYVTKHTTTHWALNFLRDLERTSELTNTATFLGFGLGLGFRVVEFGADFKRLEFSKIVRAYQQGRRRMIFLDYEGTLRPLQSSIAQLAAPDEHVLQNIQFLCSDPKNVVYIISGRQKSIVDGWFSGIDKLGVAAEHGFFYKKPGLPWDQLEPDADFSWMQPAATVCDLYTERTDGASLEVKDSTLVWRYRDCDPEFGALQAKELYDHLQNLLANFDLQVQHGNGILEVKMKGVNKGVAIDRIMHESFEKDTEEPDFILALGDDRSDEDMFAFLKTHQTTASQDAKIFTVTVGRKPSQAKFFVEDVDEARDLIQSFRFASLKSSRVQSSLELRALGTADRMPRKGLNY